MAVQKQQQVEAHFRCMMCGHEFTRLVDPSKDEERTCPSCRSNSIRPLKGKK